MAVIKGIEITVQASRQALQEFDDIVEDDQSGTYQHDHQSGMPHLVSKYIEATSGARFTIKAVVPNSVKESSDALTIDISVDGSRVEKSTFQMRLSEMVDGIWAYNLRGSRKVTEAGTVRRPWMFSEIKCGEYVKPHAVAAKLSQKPAEEPPTSSRANPKKCSIDYLGTIIVKLWRKQIYGLASERKYLTNFIGDLNDAENFNEKELKGRNLTHSVSLGEEEYVKRSHQRWKAFYVDGKHHPFAIFTFKYCSKTALQNLLLIPRTPSPVPLEERAEDELTMDELRELARRQRARFQVERETKVKPEPNNRTTNKTKSERGTKRERDEEMEALLASASVKKVKGPIANGETVDLSA